MTSPRKARTNAQNASLSTGPRTAAGKARASRNATTHAIYSALPVLGGVERHDEWDAHVAGIVASLAPATYLERALAERAALLLWRLRRVARYEIEMACGALAAVHDDVADLRRDRLTLRRENVPVTLAQARDDADACREDADALERIASTERDAPISDDDARTVLARAIDDEDDHPQRPPGGWTPGTLLAVAGLDGFGELRLDAQLWADDAARQLTRLELELAREVTARTLPDAPTLEKVQRYEGHLERSLFRTLGAFRRSGPEDE